MITSLYSLIILKNIGLGINTLPIHNWIGQAKIMQKTQGRYIFMGNSSAYQVNQQYSLIIEVDQFGYDPQSILIKGLHAKLPLLCTILATISFPFS
jgi:hypothetical protein